MKKTIAILIFALFTIDATHAQEMVRSIQAGEWKKILDENVAYTIKPEGASIVIKEGEIYLHYLTLPDSLIFSSVIPFDESVTINGVTWAPRNVDMPGTFAAKPAAAGMFYQWNRKIGWSSTDPMVNSNGGTNWDSSTPSGNTWTKANDPCPAGCRVSRLQPWYAQLCGQPRQLLEWYDLL